MSADEPDTDQEPSDETELDDDDIIDVAAVAEEIEEETATVDDDQDAADEADDDQDGSDGGAGVATDRVTPGKVYTNGLGTVGATLRDRYGTLDDDRSAVADEYAELARDLEIDDAVDDWLEEQGGIDSLSPGQTVLVTTLLWAGMVGIDDPDVIGGVADDLGGAA